MKTRLFKQKSLSEKNSGLETFSPNEFETGVAEKSDKISLSRKAIQRHFDSLVDKARFWTEKSKEEDRFALLKSEIKDKSVLLRTPRRSPSLIM